METTYMIRRALLLGALIAGAVGYDFHRATPAVIAGLVTTLLWLAVERGLQD